MLALRLWAEFFICVTGSTGENECAFSDGVIDLALLGAAFGSRRGDAAYNAAADLTEDDVVGAQDVEVLRSSYGKRTR